MDQRQLETLQPYEREQLARRRDLARWRRVKVGGIARTNEAYLVCIWAACKRPLVVRERSVQSQLDVRGERGARGYVRVTRAPVCCGSCGMECYRIDGDEAEVRSGSAGP